MLLEVNATRANRETYGWALLALGRLIDILCDGRKKESQDGRKLSNCYITHILTQSGSTAAFLSTLFILFIYLVNLQTIQHLNALTKKVIHTFVTKK